MKRLALITASLLSLTILTGCALGRGNSFDDRYSLQDRRNAKLHVKITDTVPAGAEVIGEFTTQRCHKNLTEFAPTDAILTDDLRLLAYAEGADGITNIRFERESGLWQNCWHFAKGIATLYKVKQPAKLGG